MKVSSRHSQNQLIPFLGLALKVSLFESDLIQGNVFGHPSKPTLQCDQPGFFAYDLNLEFIALLLQLSDLLTIFIFVDKTLREVMLGLVSGPERLQQRSKSKEAAKVSVFKAK